MAYKKIRLLLVVVLCLSTGLVRAQSLAQLIEQLALDVQKLSELRTILTDMKTGYAVIDKGYTNIRDIVRGNFDLHKAFLDGLLAVSPTVSRYYRVAAVVDMEGKAIVAYRAAERTWTGSGVFTPTELGEVHAVYASLSNRCGKYLDRLLMVITADQLRMSDAARLEAIDRIYLDVAGELTGLRQYNDGLSVQMVQREKELQHINLLKSMYGDHP